MHATYTHIELPAKRDAIRKLESWVNQQQQELKQKEQINASTEARSESTRTETGSPEV